MNSEKTMINTELSYKVADMSLAGWGRKRDHDGRKGDAGPYGSPQQVFSI